ncbi:hypothetical protein NHX12_009780 [Muraenolepis orangiensis]|uniref:Uncharacterized protein n=1 Tax=Muraenolepis orangiensis TaxID=630683 RepID=A0A9Q0I6N7_9TELE|nr:hypothetical protein NHX12_009780 [Muraenolepis orangiensis]
MRRSEFLHPTVKPRWICKHWLGCCLRFRSVILALGVAPHCLDPGTVSGLTVETFCGEKWEESMQAHKTIRDMSSLAEDSS